MSPDVDSASCDTRGRQSSSAVSSSPRPSFVLPRMGDSSKEDGNSLRDRSMSVSALYEGRKSGGEGSVGAVGVEQVGKQPVQRGRLLSLSSMSPPMRGEIRSIRSHNDIGGSGAIGPGSQGVALANRPSSPSLSSVASVSSNTLIGSPKSNQSTSPPSTTVTCSDLPSTKSQPYHSLSTSPTDTRTQSLQSPFAIPRKVSTFFRNMHPPSTTSPNLHRPYHPHPPHPSRRPSSPDPPRTSLALGVGWAEGGGRTRGRAVSGPARPDLSILNVVLGPWSAGEVRGGDGGVVVGGRSYHQGWSGELREAKDEGVQKTMMVAVGDLRMPSPPPSIASFVVEAPARRMGMDDERDALGKKDKRGIAVREILSALPLPPPPSPPPTIVTISSSSKMSDVSMDGVACVSLGA
ncbi:hypothetical protein HDV00_004112 [Rhizophlyctis rosea]|nr:hypothetical protein HDV00_004112 [Rhizophlyctis rosea]